MIRFETLAIHTANQPQFYMECAQLTITGGGSGSPGPTVKFPGGYSATDPYVAPPISYLDVSCANYTRSGQSILTSTLPLLQLMRE